MSIELINCAIALEAQIRFEHSANAKQAGRAIIASTGVDFHDDSSGADAFVGQSVRAQRYPDFRPTLFHLLSR